MSGTRHPRSHRPGRCQGCPHPIHPAGVCKVTAKATPHGLRNQQCGCAFGMASRIEGKPRYTPEGVR